MNKVLSKIGRGFVKALPYILEVASAAATVYAVKEAFEGGGNFVNDMYETDEELIPPDASFTDRMKIASKYLGKPAIATVVSIGLSGASTLIFKKRVDLLAANIALLAAKWNTSQANSDDMTVCCNPNEPEDDEDRIARALDDSIVIFDEFTHQYYRITIANYWKMKANVNIRFQETCGVNYRYVLEQLGVWDEVHEATMINPVTKEEWHYSEEEIRQMCEDYGWTDEDAVEFHYNSIDFGSAKIPEEELPPWEDDSYEHYIMWPRCEPTTTYALFYKH